MDKSKALVAVLAFVAGTGAGTAISQPSKSDSEIVNMKLVSSVQLDGGRAWRGRACDEGVGVESCWEVNELPSFAVDPVKAIFNDAKK